MKKGTIISLIVAAALVLSGGMMLVLGLSYAGEGTVTELTEQAVVVTEVFDSVLIDTEDCNVIFVLFEGSADPHVVIRERELTSHSVLVEEGILKIRMMDNRTWRDFIGINWESMEMTVYLPRKQYDSVRITTATGDIQVPEVLSAKEIRLHSDTGRIACDASASDLLGCVTSTGDIIVRGSAPVMMNLESSTGDINVGAVTGAELHLKNHTGKTELENVTGKILTCESTTGDVMLRGVLAEEYLQVFTDTGDVVVQNSDTATINIETSTGDVRVPAAWANKAPRIESDTGDIQFE